MAPTASRVRLCEGAAQERSALWFPRSPAGSQQRGAFAKALDAGIEALVVPSMLSTGLHLRQRVSHFASPGPMVGRRVVITGATSGIGQAAAGEMARLGASITLVARSKEKAERALAQLPAARLSANEDAGHDFVLADMADFTAVRSAALAVIERHDAIDILVHNAGALSPRYSTGPSGVEQTVASQVVGVWLLTRLLHSRMEATAQPGEGTRTGRRVITMTSAGMYTVRHDLARLEMGSAGYDGREAYARSKRAQLLLTLGWSRESYDGKAEIPHIAYDAVHPGWVGTEALREALPGLYFVTLPALRTPSEGADTLVWLAATPLSRTGTGHLWHDRATRPIDRLHRTRLSLSEEHTAFVALEQWCAELVRRAGVPEPL